MKSEMNRREFLRLSAYVLGGLALSGASGTILGACKTMEMGAVSPAAEVDLEFELRAVPREINILAGLPTTRVWMYEGEVLKGDPASLQILPDSYLGPIFRVRQGQRIRIHFRNELPEKTVVHWHGLHVPEEMDGHPHLAIGTGESYIYEFEVMDRAGTYWYHPHPHERTGPQVYLGLAGLFLVSDDEEEQALLPSGEYDLPLVIQDRTFNPEAQLVYLADGMMEQSMGFVGDRILVNGHPDPALAVAASTYRLRLLNGSNSRIYKLAWEDGSPLTVIGTDGGLLEKPVQREYVMLAPAERIELWADFSQYPVGTRLNLKSLPFRGADSEEMMAMGSSALKVGDEFQVLEINVVRESSERLVLPERLSTITYHSLADAINTAEPRPFVLQAKGMRWLINGRSFQMTAVAADEKVRLDTLEVWEFINRPGTMMMHGGNMEEEMAHPIHVHGLQFQVLERQVRPEKLADWETVQAGFVDEGWKDTVLVMPGETVKVALKFEDFTGMYMLHCHNLEHEDLGMMRNFRVI